MKNIKKTKIISIIALVLAVIGMTLGFAAFSNTLTISSSATVTPDENDFKLRAYGLAEGFTDFSEEKVFDIDSYTSTTITIPNARSGASAENAVIKEEGKTINLTNLKANFTEPSQSAEYHFVVKNEGLYDVYVNFIDYAKYFVEDPAKVCTPGKDTSPQLVEEACREMKLYIYPYTSSGELMSEMDSFKVDGSYRIKPNEYMFFGFDIRYHGGAQRADGDFSVEFEDLEFTFQSYAKGDILNP